MLTAAALRVECPPALFGRRWGQAFEVPLARLARLVIDRYPLDADTAYSVVRDDGKRFPLRLPRGDDDAVWPALFAAVRRLRPEVALEDWTHTLRGRAPTGGGGC